MAVVDGVCVRLPGSAVESSGLTTSTETLTAKLFIKLRSDGSLNQLSPDLRQKLVEYLENVKPIDDAELQTDDLTPKYPLEACKWLISDHLRRNNYRSTLSVFLVECKLSGRTFLSITDILTFIGIDLLSVEATNIVSEYVDKTSKLLLWKILTTVANCRKDRQIETKAIQTENGDETGIETKLRQLDAVYSKRKADLVLRNEPVDENLRLLEKVASFQAITGIGDELRILRERELKEARIKEKELCRREAEEYRRAMEDRFRLRMDHVIERERNVAEALEKQKNSIEEELYRQRQQILYDLSVLKEQQDDWGNTKSRQQRDLKVEFECLDDFKRQIEDRESALRQQEERHDEWLSNQKGRLANDEKRRYEERIASAVTREQALEDERKLLLQMEQSLETRRMKYDEAEMNSEKLDVAQREVEILKRQAEENALLKQEVKRLRENIREDEMRHAEAICDANERADRQLAVLKLEIQELNDKRVQEKRRYENDLCKANETAKSCAERLKQQYRHITTLHETIETLQRAKGQRLWTANTPPVSPKKSNQSFQNNDSFLSTGGHLLALDLNGTYFDTTLNATRLPPELELESKDCDWQEGDEDLSFIDDARGRIRALECEAEALESRYRTLKRNVSFSGSRFVQFDSSYCLGHGAAPNVERLAREAQIATDYSRKAVLTSTICDVSAIPVEIAQSTGLAAALDRRESCREVTPPHEEPVSQTVPPSCINETESALDEKQIRSNLGSTINLDSMWRKDEDSKSLEDSSSAGVALAEQTLVAPMSSTPYVSRTAEIVGRDAGRRDLKEDIDGRIQGVEISGGISDVESQKDFEW